MLGSCTDKYDTALDLQGPWIHAGKGTIVLKPWRHLIVWERGGVSILIGKPEIPRGVTIESLSDAWQEFPSGKN